MKAFPGATAPFFNNALRAAWADTQIFLDEEDAFQARVLDQMMYLRSLYDPKGSQRMLKGFMAPTQATRQISLEQQYRAQMGFDTYWHLADVPALPDLHDVSVGGVSGGS